MLAIAIATAALLAFSATVEADTIKYAYGGRDGYRHDDRGSYVPSYKHRASGRGYKYESGHEAYKMRDYDHEPPYERHYATRSRRDVGGARDGQQTFFFSVLNREVSPGCFPSPPADCGADCVASFSRDEGCYRCCCMETTHLLVNASSCASPADSGDVGRCRGNFKRWAFNEATGDCEPFAYGGCGGNGNRFMCKEMCERHCVEERVEKEAREGLGLGLGLQSGTDIGNCCRVIKVRSALSGLKGVKSKYRERFQQYRWSAGAVEGKDHWVSVDSKYAIWRDQGKWIIGPKERLGSGGEPQEEIGWGVIRTDEDEECPENVGFLWEYWDLNMLNPANRGLQVECEFQ